MRQYQAPFSIYLPSGLFLPSASASPLSGIALQVVGMVTFGTAKNFMKSLTSFLCAPIIIITLLCMGNRAHATVGATTPFVSYEAEDGFLGGGATIYYLTNSPTTEYSSPELEASGHAFV